MKPIIEDIQDLSESKELYDSRPNRFMIFTVYFILFMILIAIIWAIISNKEIIVKGNGLFKGNTNLYDVSSAVTGTITDNNITNGQYVKEGDILYTIHIEQLSETIFNYQNDLKEANDRLEILLGYEKSLDGNTEELEMLSENKFYDEFINRRNLLYTNMSLDDDDIKGKQALYKGNMDMYFEAISEYDQKIGKLNEVKRSISERNNYIDSTDNYYSSIVDSYLISYDYLSSQYDNKLFSYQKEIDEYKELLSNIQQRKEEESVSGNDQSVTSEETIEEQIESLSNEYDSLDKEKTKALSNLESQQLLSIEQQIANYNDAKISLNTSYTNAGLQYRSVSYVREETKDNAIILNEKAKIASEVLDYQQQVKEYEQYLNNYDIQNNNCYIRANNSGYFFAEKELKFGEYIQEGMSLGTIYPELNNDYYAEIYIDNKDIAKVKEGQVVKFEISAFPSREYGFFTGTIDNISKDIVKDQMTGNAFYLVKVHCNETEKTSDKGKTAIIKNGMACQAKIVVDEEKVFDYFLERINLSE